MNILKQTLSVDADGNRQLYAIWEGSASWPPYPEATLTLIARPLRDGSLSLEVSEVPRVGNARRVAVMVPKELAAKLELLINH